jgi:hypothetical protein
MERYYYSIRLAAVVAEVALLLASGSYLLLLASGSYLLLLASGSYLLLRYCAVLGGEQMKACYYLNLWLHQGDVFADEKLMCWALPCWM